MAKKILFIVSSFLPNTTANGVCVYNLAREYIQQGLQVYCITSQAAGQKTYEMIDGIHIYRIKEAWFGRFQAKSMSRGTASKLCYKLVHVLRNICLIPLYPNVSPIRSRQVYRTALKLVETENIDTVVGSFRPYESVYTVLKLKRKFADQVTCISYYLDVLLQNRTMHLGSAYYRWRSIRAQRKDIRTLDRVLIPLANRNEFESIYGKHDNVRFLDFPMYVRKTENAKMDLPFRSGTLNLAYVGTLNLQDRNPSRLLELLAAVQSYVPNVRLHIWGNAEEVKEIIEHYNSIAQYHGYVSSECVPYILQGADWVINISNKKNSNMIPSKKFQLFASGKPILNYVFNRQDASLRYFERYANTYYVYDNQVNHQLAVAELVDAFQKKWPLVNADEVFRENTPEIVAEKIINV